MDIFTAIMVVVPLILPLAKAYGVDPYHLAIIFLLNLEIGYLTPPLGINLFISSIRFSKPVTYVYRTVLPFIGVLLVTLLVVTYVPAFSTWLPSKIKIDEADAAFELPEISDEGEIPVEDGLDTNTDDLAEFLAGDGGLDAGSDDVDKDGGAKDGGAKDGGEKADDDIDVDEEEFDDEWGLEPDDSVQDGREEKPEAAEPEQDDGAA
jgi:hypothetical protein